MLYLHYNSHPISAYFCFITLTTIGFGDLTPDQKMEDGEKRIALCSLYLLFGIAMIAMSFNLVQEEVYITNATITNFSKWSYIR